MSFILYLIVALAVYRGVPDSEFSAEFGFRVFRRPGSLQTVAGTFVQFSSL
jgi:hypothetical protein